MALGARSKARDARKSKWMGSIPDEPERDQMMGDEHVVVPPGFLETEEEDNKLLTPIGRLHKVVTFELRFHLPVGII